MLASTEAWLGSESGCGHDHCVGEVSVAMVYEGCAGLTRCFACDAHVAGLIRDIDTMLRSWRPDETPTIFLFGRPQ